MAFLTFAHAAAQQTPQPDVAPRPQLCAATLLYWPELPTSIDGRSSAIAYEFEAPSPRTIDGATMIADTDEGWYAWSVDTVTIRHYKQGVLSLPSVATLDKPVVVRHAWVQRANGAACPIPWFGEPSAKPNKPVDNHEFPKVVATSVAAPAGTNCARPFAPAIVVKAARPEYPRDALPGVYYAQIYVVVGDHDDLVDSWVYKPSINPEIDANALAAARVSKYQSALSYCRKVRADYLFKADFQP